MAKIHTLQLDLDLNLINQLSAIDRFSGEWSGIERRKGSQTIKQLKSIATVQSVGASTRIEGSKLSNDQVRSLILANLNIDKLEHRDQQEVVGYFLALDYISESHQEIRISDRDVKDLHQILMKFSDKDQWHKGKYKQHANSVDAHYPDGEKVTIFQTAAPGLETEEAMRALFAWYNSDTTTPALIKSAAFVYEFLSIHPFQDGNGRLSRLLSTLLLLKHQYSWIEYVSFEHEIEHQKKEYYQVLMECQQHRPGENINAWISFFLTCLSNIQTRLMQKIATQHNEDQLSPREKKILHYVDSNPGARSGEIASSLQIPLPSVKRMLSELTAAKLLTKYGSGTGTNYTTEQRVKIQREVIMNFSNETRTHQFELKHKHSFIQIDRIILTPTFDWSRPDDWGNVLAQQQPVLLISYETARGTSASKPYSIIAWNNPRFYKPVFTLDTPILLPADMFDNTLGGSDYPVSVTLEMTCREEALRFEIALVYDASLH